MKRKEEGGEGIFICFMTKKLMKIGLKMNGIYWNFNAKSDHSIFTNKKKANFMIKSTF